MSSIYELFGAEGLEDESGGAPFDPSKLDETLNALLQDRPVAGAPEGYQRPAPSAPESGSEGVEGSGGAGGSADPPAPLPPPTQLPDPGLSPTPQPPPPDLFEGMSDLDKAELLAMRQGLADPERRDAIRRAYLGVETPAPAAVAPPPPAPTLPEHIDPDSFEAQLWRDNQAMMTELRQLREGVNNQTAQTEAQLAQAAARKVTGEFAQRYGDKLSAEEIQAICSTAGARKLPQAFAATGSDMESAMTQSLEFVLRSNDTLLAKVLSVPAAPVVPTPPGETQASIDRKRTLTALSSAASPTGDVPRRQPITHREDGKLSESSRQGLLNELMGKLNADGEGN